MIKLLFSTHRVVSLVFVSVLFFGVSSSMAEVTLVNQPQLSSHDRENMLCLAMNIYHEARGEDIEGQQAIAAVTMNRVRSDAYPNAICPVVWQHKQFSWTRLNDTEDYLINDLTSWRKALVLARQAMDGDLVSSIGDATHYHANYIRPYWANGGQLIATIGNHSFYSMD